MLAYLNVLQLIIDKGELREGRNGGVWTLANHPGTTMMFDFKDGFPILTTKFVSFSQVRAELLFFLSGGDNLEQAHAYGCNVWDQNATAPYWVAHADYPGHLGNIYGVQWVRGFERNGEPVNQIAEVIENIKLVKADSTHDSARRLIVTAWNPAQIHQMCLPPCHMIFQFDVSPSGKLSLCMTQRSADFALGVPFNISSYALLLAMVAHVTGLEPSHLTIYFGNAHIYANHMAGVTTQLEREPIVRPQLWLNPEVKDIFTFTAEDIKLLDYRHGGKIAFDMAV